ncbi:MAG: hypothetical protein J0H99_05290, partial [Rhodospirillales bacterium]|nr:hypothetical protein [Rhodospirillales bacterium]
GKSRKAILVLHLGEVDCGYVIWYRAAKYGESVEAQMEQSISAYFGFLDEVGFEKVVVTGATLPTITDTDQDGEVVKARSAVRISQTDRTKLTLEYNSRLANEAARRGYSYAEVTQDVIDPVSGLTRPSFRNRNPFDHHMDQVLAASVWARRLNDCLETLDPIMMPQVALAASADTFVKGIGLHSKDLPHELKHGASKGDTLRAKVHAVSGSIS